MEQGLINFTNFKEGDSAFETAVKGIHTRRLTPKCIKFENVYKGVNLELCLFFKDVVPENFNICDWFWSKDSQSKFKMSQLFNELIFDKKFTNNQPVRHITTDVVKFEDKDIIAYFITLRYEHNWQKDKIQKQ